MTDGLSIIICTYNGVSRLRATLEHLARQVETLAAWEVIVVDNASTDGSANVARQVWDALGAASQAQLTVLHEPTPGKSYALDRGFATARYALLAIVDDDNWLAPNWVALAQRIMAEHPSVGAAGGFNEPVFEAGMTPPKWFEGFGYAYAVGPQGDVPGDVTESRGFLWGAGTVIRRAAWDPLVEAGFEPLLTCRTGSSLASGGDMEMCHALRLGGWRLWYEPTLRLQHFLPAGRLNWKYMRRLWRGFGASEPGIAPYRALLETHAKNLPTSWLKAAARTMKELAGLSKWIVKSRLGRDEGHGLGLQVELKRGRLAELWRLGKRYDGNFAVVESLKQRLSKQPAPVASEGGHIEQKLDN